MVPIIVLLGVVAVVVALQLGARKLRAKMSTWSDEAAARGYVLDLTHRAPPALPFDLFTSVHDGKVWTTVTRPGSNDSAVFYKFEVPSGDVDHKFRRTCALIELPFSAPKIALRPRALQTVPAKPTDGADVLLGLAAFDDVFRLQTVDDEFARALFQSDFAAWLLTAAGRAGEVEFELRDSQLLCAGPKADSIDEMIDFLEWAQTVRDRAHASQPGPSQWGQAPM